MNEKPPSNCLTRQFRVLRIHEIWSGDTAKECGKGTVPLPHEERLLSPRLLALPASQLNRHQRKRPGHK